ncbi:MAG TPA: ATP-binding protein [Caulobacteraceae bacterium]|jgi:Cdc6-like AAA superfamily ATPase
MPDWDALRTEVLETFTPGPPINEVALFAGRRGVIQRLQDTTVEKARHPIIYGERGVGKTSLANIFHKDLNTPTRHVEEIYVTSDVRDSFDSLWRKVFRRIRRPKSNLTADLEYLGPIEPDHVILELSKFGPNLIPIIIIDEYDRIEDADCRILMTDVIKGLANTKTNPTIVLVGVADNITQLIVDHASITRNVAQIPMTRMIPEEIEQIIVSRIKRLRMRITSDAVWRIVYFSAGLPFYAHSLGKYASLQAIKSKKEGITENHVIDAIDDCMADVDYSIRESYTRATERIYRKENKFAKILAACALAQTNDLGQFVAVAVEGPLTDILGVPYKVPAFGFALNEMCAERGHVFVKTGERKTYRYHFRDAAMQPYVIMKSLKGGIISREILEKYQVTRQLSLSIGH